MGFDYRTSTGLGKQTLGGHKPNLVHIWTQEKGAVTPQETHPVLPVNVDSITGSMDMHLSKLGDNGGQRSVACCNPWGLKGSNTA